MKNAKEAIKYGIETLKVTPDEMFALIESSKDYNGDDYKRWLASQIIKLAEEEGVGYSQLLVKRFSIISELIGNEDAEIKYDFLSSISQGKDICYGFEDNDFGCNEINWFTGIDLDIHNSEFFAEAFSDLYEKILSGGICNLNILLRLTRDSIDKSGDLYLEAKSRGLICKNEGMLLLYRMCSIANSFVQGNEFKFSFVTDVNFILDPDLQELWKYVFSMFSCSGFTLKAIDIFNGVSGGADYAYVECISRDGKEAPQDDLILNEANFIDGEVVVSTKKRRYTSSSVTLLNKILSDAKLKDSKTLKVIETRTGELQSYPEGVEVSKDVLGFLNLGSVNGAWLSTLPSESIGKNCIEITKRNLEECIIYYALSYALKSFNINEDIKVPVTGDSRYNKLLYNCLPLFLYSNNSLFKSSIYKCNDLPPEVYKSSFEFDSELCNSLLAKGEVYNSFESKELINFCKGYAKYLISEYNDIEVYNMCFNDLRKEANLSEFNSQYINLIQNLCGYLKGLYRELQDK